MIFLELVLQNFGPYYGKHTINLCPKLGDEQNPIILFGGMNGGGKTTLMDAIRLALYGPRAQCSTRGNMGYGEFLSQSVNSQTAPGEQARIELTFEHILDDQWQQLKIVRHWTKNPKDGKDILGIIDGDWPDTALANTWDEYIENLLPLGISNLFLFDGEQVKELAEQDIPPPNVVDAIKSLLGLELAERLATDLEILVTRKRKALANASQLKNIEEIEEKLNHLNQEYETARQKVFFWEKNLKQANIQEKQAHSKFRIEGGKIAAEKSKLETQRHNLEQQLEQQRNSLRELTEKTLPLGLILPLLKQAKTQGEKELISHQATIAQEILVARDQRLINYLDGLGFSQEQIENIKIFFAQENEKVKTEETLGFLKVSQEELKQLDNVLDNILPFQSEMMKRIVEKTKILELEIDNTERQLAIAASPEAYEKLEQELKQAKEELSHCRVNYEMEQQKCDKIEKTIAQVKKDLDKYSQQVIEDQNNEHIIISAGKVQETLQEFRKRLTLKKLNKLEAEVTECFRYLLHKTDLVHQVVIDTGNFSLSLYDPEGGKVPKHRLSAGEKQLLAIAFLWGLARVSGRNLPIAIDTPLGRLDSSHRNNLVERYFPTASHQVILLSTDTEIGKTEVEMLREQGAIAREYLLEYDPKNRQTSVKEGYFF
jgi:DNA sulfur modification protein DndD